jgi:hypothetical protein
MTQYDLDLSIPNIPGCDKNTPVCFKSRCHVESPLRVNIQKVNTDKEVSLVCAKCGSPAAVFDDCNIDLNIPRRDCCLSNTVQGTYVLGSSEVILKCVGCWQIIGKVIFNK